MSLFYTIAFTALIALGSAQFSDCAIDGCLQDFESAPQANQYCSSLLGEASVPGFNIYAPVNLPTFAPDCIRQIQGVPNQIQYNALTSACHCANYPRTYSASTSTSATSTHVWSEINSHTPSSTGSVAPGFPTPTSSRSPSVAPSFPIPTPSSSRSVAPGFPTPTSTPSLAPPFTVVTDNFNTPLATSLTKISSSSAISSPSPSSFSSSWHPAPKSNTTTRPYATPYATGAIVPTTTCMSTLTYNSTIYTIPCSAVPKTLTPLKPSGAATGSTTLPLLTISPSGSGVPNSYRNGTSTFQTSTLLTGASSQLNTHTPVGPSGNSAATGRLTVFTGAATGRDSSRAGAVLFLTVLGGVVLAL